MNQTDIVQTLTPVENDFHQLALVGQSEASHACASTWSLWGRSWFLTELVPDHHGLTVFTFFLGPALVKPFFLNYFPTWRRLCKLKEAKRIRIKKVPQQNIKSIQIQVATKISSVQLPFTPTHPASHHALTKSCFSPSTVARPAPAEMFTPRHTLKSSAALLFSPVHSFKALLCSRLASCRCLG